MATNTTNLHLIKPAGSERVQISQINQNMDILDEKIGAVGNTSVQSQVNSLKNQVATTQITNEYSTVLSVINAIAANKTLPFTIQKSGNSAYTDLPAGLTNTCEWNVICIGSSMRITAVLTVYTGGSSRNGFSYTANIYNGSYIFTWQTIDQRRNNLTSIASDTTILGLEPGAYQINLSAASNYIPERYGTLVIDKSAVTYGVATFISTDGHLYVRHMNGSSAWHGPWTQPRLHGLSEAVFSPVIGDLNNADYAGAHLFNSATQNTPATYGICFTIATTEPTSDGVGWVFQLAFATSYATKMFMRSRINNGTWSAWKSITFS